MIKSEIQQKILNLRKDLNLHNYNYYVLSNPKISDYQYDMLMKDLEKLEKENPEFADSNSPSQRVGNDINQNFKQVKHKYPMLSLGNTYNLEELKEFDFRIQKLLEKEQNYNYVCELKYDGAAVSLTYRNGLLYQAITRGDGVQGDDVTENIKTIKIKVNIIFILILKSLNNLFIILKFQNKNLI